MENVTDRTSNPFGMTPPAECPANPDGPDAVFGYGDANADFHVVGDHPGVHGGRETGVPFTGSESGRRLQGALHEVGFAAEPYSDAPEYDDLFASYVHMCVPPAGRTPADADYALLERFFDAELRAVNAHVLLPVGDRATEHVVRTYTTHAHRLDPDAAALHTRELRGRGFLVVPVREPAEWTADGRERFVARLRAILASDYRQTKGVATRIG